MREKMGSQSRGKCKPIHLWEKPRFGTLVPEFLPKERYPLDARTFCTLTIVNLFGFGD
jgi:hypothetical protein